MIKQTFYNLPDAKRERIISAIFKEFSSSSSDKISINNIIKAAEISRGSFYQYFDDKVDLVEVLMKSFIDKTLAEVNRAVALSRGDVFYTYEKLFDIVAELANNSSQKIIMKTLIRNIKANDNLISDYITNRFKGIANAMDVLKSFNVSNLKYTSDEDVEYLTQILNQVFKNSMFNLFVIGKPYEQVKKSFTVKLEIIKTGALK